MSQHNILSVVAYTQACTNPGYQVTMVPKISLAARIFCILLYILYIYILAFSFGRWLLNLQEICAGLHATTIGFTPPFHVLYTVSAQEHAMLSCCTSSNCFLPTMTTGSQQSCHQVLAITSCTSEASRHSEQAVQKVRKF
jgi:hypothetical protein